MDDIRRINKDDPRYLAYLDILQDISQQKISTQPEGWETPITHDRKIKDN